MAYKFTQNRMPDENNANCQDCMTLNHLLGTDALENKVYT